MTDPRDTMRWARRGGALAALVIGWIFIAWQNHFHISAPMVFVCLAYLAVVATIYNLWRTGAAAVAEPDDGSDSTWAKPAGAVGELEREKRTLLKAIKEAEFDHQMGKLSKRDADEMIRIYRARAIEVIKDIDRAGSGAAGSAREQILREVRARLELEAKSQKKADAKPAAKSDAKAGKAAGKLANDAAPPSAAESALAASASTASEAAQAAETPDPTNQAAQAVASASAPPEAAAKAVHGAAAIDDEAMNADSTTAVEPARDDPAKEATP